MKYTAILLTAAFFAGGIMSSCRKAEPEKPLTMVFYPNESSESMKDARNAFQEILSEATGRKVEILTTTDYNIALEALVSGKADMAYVGAEGYINAHKRNNAIVPVVTNSGPSGTRDDAKYYSFIAVPRSKAEEYRTAGGTFDLRKLKGKKMSFVSATSTSGFVLPAAFLAKQFGITDTDKMVVGTEVFSKVIFAGSHQGSQVAIFRGDADAAAFAIPQTIGVYDLLEGEAYQTGASYRVVKGADEPFAGFPGSEITVIQSIPVLNAPIVINTQTVSSEDAAKIREVLTSEKTARHPGIFNMKDASVRGIFPKYTEKTKLVATDDAWYDEIRKLSE